MSRKRPREEPEDDLGLGGLYDFLPPPDPDKDAAAKEAAEKKNKGKPPLPPEDKSKVIFLDVDGVLLPAGSVETIFIDGVALPVRDTIKESDFKGTALDNLRSIVQQTGATIVLSSEWRRSDTLSSSIGAVLKGWDIPVFHEKTPIFKPREDLQKANLDAAIVWCERRAREIGKWLKDHKEVTAWVAIDDLDFNWADSVRMQGTPFIKYRSVHTDALHCITDSDQKQAVQLLLNPPPEPRIPTRVRSVDLTASESSGMLCSTEDSAPERLRLG
jgi:hypothetical protein